MSILAGVDGVKDRWLALLFDTATGELRASIVSTAALPDLACDVLAIDVPIGLSEAERREADTLARSRLGPSRSSSVFPSPIRPVLDCATRLEASNLSQQVCGRGVSAQGFALFGKIREVRSLLKKVPDFAARVHEVHPEVSFAAWAGHPLAHYKGTPQGQDERQRLIAAHFGSGVFSAVQEAARVRLPPVDLADAFAALWSAGRILDGTACRLPEQECLDAEGLPAHIWF